MTAPIRQPTFAGGEISPTLYARSDNAIYEKALRTLRNMVIMRQGGATGRPGTQYVATTLNGGAQVRLIPFIFNETGLGQSYVLEFGNLYITFYQNGAPVVVVGAAAWSGATAYVIGNYVTFSGVQYYAIQAGTNHQPDVSPTFWIAQDRYQIPSPYAQADLATLKFAESADIVTIVHPLYAPRELGRIAATNWTLTTIPFQPQISGPSTAPVASGTAGPVVPYAIYEVTAISSSGEESFPGFTSFATSGGLALATAAAPVALTWGASVSSNIISYRIYRALGTGSVGNFRWGAFGFIGISITTSFSDSGIVPDFDSQPPVFVSLFLTAGNFPSTVGFAQQRRYFANTLNNPLAFWGSQPGDYYNFSIHVTSEDSDAIFGTLAGDEVNSIEHIFEIKFMLMLTTGAEIYVQGNGSGVVTPSAINASVQSQYGSSTIRPLKAGDVMMFNQSLGSFIRDFSFDFAIDGYRGNDITVFASHLFEGYQLSDWAYQKVPDSLVWAVRSDGTLLCCTYVREQQVLAWSRNDLTNGVAENICSIPENGEYAVYISIKRVINGSTVRYIERMSSRIWLGPAAAVTAGTANALGDPIDATYLDCYSSFDGRNTSTTTMTLTATGPFSTADTAYQQQLTLTASAGFFTSLMVGNQIFLEDALFVSSQGAKGNQIRLTIQVYTSPTVVTVTPSGIVPALFQALAITIWARAVATVSGLGYLALQQVSIWADRYVVGSPLNYHLSTVYTVPLSGILTLDKPYAVIYVGLPMVQDFQTLDRETAAGESMLASRKRSAKLAIYLQNTRTLFAGSENPDTNLQNTASVPLFQMYELMRGMSQVEYDEPPELTTDQDYIIFESSWNRNGRLFCRNLDPSPLTILAVSPGGDSKSTNPAYERV